MLKIRGVGNQKFKNYGSLFLKTINSLNQDGVKQLQLENIIDEKYLNESQLLSLKIH